MVGTPRRCARRCDRSIEGCVSQLTCNPTALYLWVAVFAIGFLVIPAVFALALRRGPPA